MSREKDKEIADRVTTKLTKIRVGDIVEFLYLPAEIIGMGVIKEIGVWGERGHLVNVITPDLRESLQGQRMKPDRFVIKEVIEGDPFGNVKNLRKRSKAEVLPSQ